MGQKCCSLLTGRWPANDEAQDAPLRAHQPARPQGSMELQQLDHAANSASKLKPPQEDPPVNRRSRKSVSAEAYGEWNKREAFTPPVHPKTDEQKRRIAHTLQDSFLFSRLNEKDMETILFAMEERQFAAGHNVIVEGDDGECLFLIEDGSTICLKEIDGEMKCLKTFSRGEVFGELALLYNCKRTATIQVKDACACWQLDRQTFNHIVRDAAMKWREKYESILDCVPILQGITRYERAQIADVLTSETYGKGEAVVNQDEVGDKFYIVEEGKLYAQKNGKRVMEYKEGDYFGELALLKNQPRAASVIVSSDVAKVLALPQRSFYKLLGNINSAFQLREQDYVSDDSD